MKHFGSQMDSIDKKSNKILYAINLCIEWAVSLLIQTMEVRLPFVSKRFGPLERHRNTLVNVVGLTGLNAVSGILLMLTQVKLANVLGAAAFGVYSYCIALGETGATFVRYGRDKTMTRDLIQRPERRTFIIANTFALALVNLLLFILIILLFHRQLDISITWGYMLLAIAPCLVSLDFDCVYEAMHLMSWHSIYYLLQKIFFLISIWGAIIMVGVPSLLQLGIALFVSWSVIILMQIKEIKSTIPDSIISQVRPRNIVLLYRENFIIALSTFCGVAFGPLNRLILNEYADSASVGIFSAGLQVYLISQFILHQVARVGNPIMAEAGKEGVSSQRRRLLVWRYLFVTLACSLPFAIPLALFPHTVVSVFFTKEYAPLGNYLPIFAFYLVTMAIGVVFTQFLISMRADKSYFTLYVGGALLTLVTAYAIIPTWGILGAVLSLCVPRGITSIAYGLASIRHLR